jgi:aldehyde dehydrogenase (NAD+)/betaine-aldehyde dehydrogenase
MTTGFVVHERYMWHDTGSAALFFPSGGFIEPAHHSESPETKRRFRGLVEATGLLGYLTPLAPTPATENDLLRYHTQGYVDKIKAYSAAFGGDAGMAAPVGRDTYEIALLAVGGVFRAYDAVITGEVDNAYALVRPPGHHALPDMGIGFCIFGNNVLSIKRAKEIHGIERVAVVDWDVHHGNGTQFAFYEDPSVLTISMHQDNFLPPDSGAMEDVGAGPGEGYNINVPLPPGSGTGAYLATFERVVTPALLAFDPDLIVVGSGLDAAGFDPLARMLLHSESYRSMTRMLLQVASRVCDGKVVMVHEGGYDAAYVPFCGLAVLEELSGVRTECEDPILSTLVGVGGQELQPHQDEVIREAAEAARTLAPERSRHAVDTTEGEKGEKTVEVAIKNKLLIGGSWLPSSDGGEFETLDPATGEVIGTLADATSQDVDSAVEAARTAFDSDEWRGLSPAARARLLWRVGDLIEKHAGELAKLETRDQGQPVGLSRVVSVAGAAEHFRYYAGWVTKIEGETLPNSFPGVFNYTRREPVGVCALITPWNFPLMIATWKLAPALACGNTVVLKPAEQTSLTAIRLGELMQEAGVPDGVVNIVTGAGGVGAALARHPDVDKVSFTGSTAVGKEIVRASAGNLKRVSLELGGKAPNVVLADADIDAAVAGSLQGALLNSGQVCAAYARFFVERARAEEFAEKCAVASSAMKLGPGLDEGTQLGPLVSEEHLERVDSYVRKGQEEGADLVSGGGRAEGELADGYFYRPTVFANVTDEMTVAREEIFGPVITVMPYDDPDELVGRANDTEYGLAAAVWTRDVGKAHRLAETIKAGTVYVNMVNAIDAAAPWGGYKSSGWGREMGRQAIDLYTEVKSVWTSLS